MSQINDIVVIGGGINGVSIAFHLATHGARVTLLEKDFIAAGPTGKSSAVIRQHYSNPVTARMALKSLNIWRNFAEIVGGDCGFTQTGFLIAVPPRDVEGLHANIALQQSVGINTRFVTPHEIQEIEPYADLAGLGGGAYEPEAGYCDASMAANSFAQAARRLGTQFHSGVIANSIEVSGDRIQGVHTNQGFFPASKVVVACGPWTNRLLAPLGLTLPLIAARVKTVLFRRPQDFAGHSIWGDFVNQVYMRPETGNLMLVGSISPDEAEDHVPNPDSFNEQVDLDTLSEFAEKTARRFPAMLNSHLTHSFAALYDITPDWHPVIDFVPGFQGLYVCAGSSGHGFKLAPAVGMMVAQMVLEGKGPQDDVHLFAWDRFQRGDLVRGRYAYSIVG